MLTRRHFWKFAGAAGLAAALPRSLFAAADELRISILHTTDLHGHFLPTVTYEGVTDVGGLARCASCIRRWQAENPHWVLIDAGDVFQGTDASWRTRGEIMAKAFNWLGYDAWTVGNHEFDWGIEPLANFCREVQAPALSANARLEGRARELMGSHAPKSWILKEVAGFRIGVIGLTTPGLPFWFLPDLTAGFKAEDPAEAARRAAEELRAERADAIVLCVHMGERQQGDDFANRVRAVARAVPGAAVIVAGHTHRDVPRAEVAGIPYTQANYHGIHAGRADLVFDRASRRLRRVETQTLLMDASHPMDPAVLSLVAKDLEDSARALGEPAGFLRETLSSTSSHPGSPSQIERLIALAIRHALRARGVALDAVLHGTFSEAPFPAGLKTVADVWSVLPYENFVATAALLPEEILAVMQECLGGGRGARRSLAGLQLKLEPSANPPRPVALLDRHGRPLERGKRLVIAANSYDAAGGGTRLMRLREAMAAPDAGRHIHPVQTREALIDYLRQAGPEGVSADSLVWV